MGISTDRDRGTKRVRQTDRKRHKNRNAKRHSNTETGTQIKRQIDRKRLAKRRDKHKKEYKDRLCELEREKDTLTDTDRVTKKTINTETGQDRT